MNDVKKLTMHIIKITAIVAIGISFLSVIFISNFKPFIFGIIFGSLLGILNFYDLYLTLTKASTMNSGNASNYASFKYVIRYVFMGIALLVSIKATYINVIGTIIGLVLIKIVVLITNLFNDKKFFLNIKRKGDK